jgi:hypothetical protein
MSVNSNPSTDWKRGEGREEKEREEREEGRKDRRKEGRKEREKGRERKGREGMYTLELKNLYCNLQKS